MYTSQVRKRDALVNGVQDAVEVAKLAAKMAMQAAGRGLHEINLNAQAPPRQQEQQQQEQQQQAQEQQQQQQQAQQRAARRFGNFSPGQQQDRDVTYKAAESVAEGDIDVGT
jgi:DNA anti-recombination protein RmuC